LWDFYHMQLEDGDLIEKFTAGADLAAHVQIGDVPGRHEPGTGEVNHANLIGAVRAAGFKEPIGLEFMPLDGNWQRAVRGAGAGCLTGGKLLRRVRPCAPLAPHPPNGFKGAKNCGPKPIRGNSSAFQRFRSDPWVA